MWRLWGKPGGLERLSIPGLRAEEGPFLKAWVQAGQQVAPHLPLEVFHLPVSLIHLHPIHVLGQEHIV